MERVIVGGCSFTNDTFRSHLESHDASLYKKWPDYIPNSIITNVAEDGIGNVRIIDKVLTAVFNADKVDRIVIALTDWWRFELPHITINAAWAEYYNTLNEGGKAGVMDSTPWVKYHVDYCREFDWGMCNPGVQDAAINNTLLAIMKLHEICKSRGIKLDIFQMLKTDFGDAKNTKDEYIDHEFSKELMNHDWFDILWEAHGKDGLNLIGWPWHTNIGGFVAEEILGWGPDSLRICSDTIDEDLHPSEAGHKALGEWYNEKAKA